MKNYKIAIGIISTITFGMIIYTLILHQKHMSDRKLATVADAGYETAIDILYPLKHKRIKRR